MQGVGLCRRPFFTGTNLADRFRRHVMNEPRAKWRKRTSRLSDARPARVAESERAFEGVAGRFESFRIANKRTVAESVG